MQDKLIYQLSAIVLLFMLMITYGITKLDLEKQALEFKHQLHIRDSVNNRNKAINDSLQIVIDTNQPLFKHESRKTSLQKGI